MSILGIAALALCAAVTHSAIVDDPMLKTDVGRDQFEYLCSQCIGTWRATYEPTKGWQCDCNGTWCGATKEKETDEEFQKNIRDAHNYYRVLHGAEPVYSSSGLEDKLIDAMPMLKHNGTTKHFLDQNGDSYGINLFKDSKINDIPAWKAVASWYSGVNAPGYDPDHTTEEQMESAPEIIPFIHLVWKENSNIGCVRYTDANNTRNILCIYYLAVEDEILWKNNVPQALLTNVQSRNATCKGNSCICIKPTREVPTKAESTTTTAAATPNTPTTTAVKNTTATIPRTSAAPTTATPTPGCEQNRELGRHEEGTQLWNKFKGSNDNLRNWTEGTWMDIAPMKPLKAGERIEMSYDTLRTRHGDTFYVTFWPYLDQSSWNDGDAERPVFRLQMDIRGWGQGHWARKIIVSQFPRPANRTAKLARIFRQRNNFCFTLGVRIAGKGKYKIRLDDVCAPIYRPEMEFELETPGDSRKIKYAQFSNIAFGEYRADLITSCS